MFWWGWGSGWGWVAGLAMLAFWILVILVAVVLLRRELPHAGTGGRTSPALRLLEERYARGEMDRDDFLHRKDVLLHGSAGEPRPPSDSTAQAPPTEPLPPTGESTDA